MNKWMKKLTAALCAAVLMCGMAVTAYAGGGEEWDGLDPVEPPPMETVDPGEGFTEDGNGIGNLCNGFFECVQSSEQCGH